MPDDETLEPLRRVIARRRGKESGPLVVCVAGIHGNEPAGIRACRRVSETLERTTTNFRGEWLALAGNVVALRQNRRFVDEDLNRIWSAERIQDRRSGLRRHATAESFEQDEIMFEVESSLARNPTATYFLDMHTTSAPGASFSVFADTLRNRKLALSLPGALVLGLEEHLDGTLLNYVSRIGHVAVGFESGQHLSPVSVDLHELAIWKTLVLAGCVDRSRMPETVAVAARTQANRLPRVVEIGYRHGVGPDDGFAMAPGFENMREVAASELLARDRNGEVRSRYRGRVLMPLYQKQGSDGFFIVRDVKRIWLSLSTLARRLQAGRLARYLPGVSRHPTLDDALVVEWTVARGLLIDLFHFLGYRRRSADGPSIVMRWMDETPRG